MTRGTLHTAVGIYDKALSSPELPKLGNWHHLEEC